MYGLSRAHIRSYRLELIAAAGVLLGGIVAASAQEQHPYLRLAGTIPVGQAAVKQGGDVGFFGAGFCAAPECSDITLTIGDRVVAAGIRAARDGSFSGRFRVIETPGLYFVHASQKLGDTKIEDVKPLLVPVGEPD
jgi:hypothetical protein